MAAHNQLFHKDEQRYQDLFNKYGIPYEYGVEEFHALSTKLGKSLFWEDKHPNREGNVALSYALDNLIKKAGF